MIDSNLPPSHYAIESSPILDILPQAKAHLSHANPCELSLRVSCMQKVLNFSSSVLPQTWLQQADLRNHWLGHSENELARQIVQEIRSTQIYRFAKRQQYKDVRMHGIRPVTCLKNIRIEADYLNCAAVLQALARLKLEKIEIGEVQLNSPQLNGRHFLKNMKYLNLKNYPEMQTSIHPGLVKSIINHIIIPAQHYSLAQNLKYRNENKTTTFEHTELYVDLISTQRNQKEIQVIKTLLEKSFMNLTFSSN